MKIGDKVKLKVGDSPVMTISYISGDIVKVNWKHCNTCHDQLFNISSLKKV
jgi:uncharacterized protein YodC (DUF2158 family)